MINLLLLLETFCAMHHQEIEMALSALRLWR